MNKSISESNKVSPKHSSSKASAPEWQRQCSEYEQRCEAAEAELVRVKAQRDALLTACRELHDDLFALIRASGAPLYKHVSLKHGVAAIAAAEKGAQLSLKASKTS